MSYTNSARISIWGAFARKLNDYKVLVKFRLSLLVVFSSAMAYLIAAAGEINWMDVCILSLGGFLVTGAANALNQVLEKDYDRLMKRTMERPLVTGRMNISEAVLSAGLMSLAGITLLAMLNPLTALLGTVAFISYSFIYTPMKRVSPLAVVIGAIPGALPTMIGCVAAQGGTLSWLALFLFALQFLWQFPHFWAIAWLSHEDYKNAGYKMLISRSGERDAEYGWQSFLYGLFLLPISVVPFFQGATGWVSMVILLSISIIYLMFSWNLYKQCSRKAALQLMFSSFFYLPLALMVLYFDKLI